MADFTLQALHDEIENDPEGLGYKTGSVWKEDNIIADLINAKNYIVDASEIEMEVVRSITTYEAYNDLAIDEQEWLRWMTPNSGVFRVTEDMKVQLTGRTLASGGSGGSGNDNSSFWSVATRSEMAPAMLALIELSGSRAEVLWGVNTIISISQVGHAANL